MHKRAAIEEMPMKRYRVRGAGLFATVSLASAACSQGGESPAAPVAEELRTIDAGVREPPRISARAEHGLEISPVRIDRGRLPPGELEAVGQGSYLVNAAGECSTCHSPPGASPRQFLSGGTPFILDGSNVVYSRNLTPDPRTGLALTENEFIEALRTGRDYRNADQLLLVMPWPHFRWMALSDSRAIYAYLRAIPPVFNSVPADQKSNSILNGAPAPFQGRYNEGDVERPLPPDQFNFDPDQVVRGLAIRPIDAPRDLWSVSRETIAQIGRGSYLANIAACSSCHTNPARQAIPSQPNFNRVNTAAYLSGGQVFPTPPPIRRPLGQTRAMSADLTGATHGFLNEPEDSFDRFEGIIRSGTHTDENPPRKLGYPMPWDHFRLLEPNDLRAMYTYLKSIPPRTGGADKETQDWAPFCFSGADCRNVGPSATCNVPTQECVGKSCAIDADCFACQRCSGSLCVAPAPSAACLTNGI